MFRLHYELDKLGTEHLEIADDDNRLVDENTPFSQILPGKSLLMQEWLGLRETLPFHSGLDFFTWDFS